MTIIFVTYNFGFHSFFLWTYYNYVLILFSKNSIFIEKICLINFFVHHRLTVVNFVNLLNAFIFCVFIFWMVLLVFHYLHILATFWRYVLVIVVIMSRSQYFWGIKGWFTPAVPWNLVLWSTYQNKSTTKDHFILLINTWWKIYVLIVCFRGKINLQIRHFLQESDTNSYYNY